MISLYNCLSFGYSGVKAVNYVPIEYPVLERLYNNEWHLLVKRGRVMISLYLDLTTKTAYSSVAKMNLGIAFFDSHMLVNRTWQNFMEAGREV